MRAFIEAAPFPYIFKFCTFLPKFSNILPFHVFFLPFFWKITRMPVISRIGPENGYIVSADHLVVMICFLWEYNKSAILEYNVISNKLGGPNEVRQIY